MKTLEEIKKEFEERLNNICVHGFKYKDCTRGCFPRLIESTISQTKQELIEECICNEWDGKGISTCGFPCPVHNKNARDNRIHKEGFDAGYKKGYKVGYMEGWLNGIKKH